VKTKRRKTREQSQAETRERLLRAAEKAFIKHGFDASPVEAIAEDAGYSRGAFYSNFHSKDELFLALLEQKRREMEQALDEVVRREADPARRLRGVLDWYVNQGVNRGWLILENEFLLHSFRNRAARARMEEFNRRRFTDYAALAATYFAESGVQPPGKPEALAVLLFAAAKGLDELAMLDVEGAHQDLYAECRDLIFKRLIPAAEKGR